MDDLGHPRQVENTYLTRGEENPFMFQLGKYHTVKCQELAAVSMHAGEQFQIACPEHLAHGGKSFYAVGDDSFQVPSNTPLTYNFNILDCQSDFGVLEANIKVFHDKILAEHEKAAEAQRKKIEEEQKKQEAQEKEEKKSVEEKKVDIKKKVEEEEKDSGKSKGEVAAKVTEK